MRGLIPARNLIVEPAGRGTAVAIAYGGAVIAERLGADTVVAVMPADHHVDAGRWLPCNYRAPRSSWRASEAAIVVVGITPTRPETGYGYQQIGTRGGNRLQSRSLR